MCNTAMVMLYHDYTQPCQVGYVQCVPFHIKPQLVLCVLLFTASVKMWYASVTDLNGCRCSCTAGQGSQAAPPALPPAHHSPPPVLQLSHHASSLLRSQQLPPRGCHSHTRGVTCQGPTQQELHGGHPGGQGRRGAGPYCAGSHAGISDSHCGRCQQLCT